MDFQLKIINKIMKILKQDSQVTVLTEICFSKELK